jgi:hypothetical protein
MGACGGSDDESNPKAIQSPTPEESSGAGDGSAVFTAVDFGFQGPDTLPAGKSKITLKNDGKELHMLALVQLLNGKTFEDAQAFIDKNGISGKPPSWAKNAGGVKPVKPGDTGSAGVNLEPGNYLMVCFINSKSHGNKPHALLGMFQPLTVQ